MPIVSDDEYIATFHATGCQNDLPFLEWWKTKSKEQVLNDMYTYCEVTKDALASNEQRSQCCGADDIYCVITECVKQIEFTRGNWIKLGSQKYNRIIWIM